MEEEILRVGKTKSEAVHGSGDKAQEGQVTIDFKLSLEKTIEQEFRTWLETEIQEIVELPGFLKATIYDRKPFSAEQLFLNVEYIFTSEEYLQDFEKFSLKTKISSSKFFGKVEIEIQSRVFSKSFMAKPKRPKKDPVPYKVALVTGSNRGIGLEFCRQLLLRGTKVYACCRNSSPELEKLGVTKIISGIDLSDPAKIETIISEIKDVKFDLIIQNAGAGIYETVNNVTRNGIRTQMEVNAFAPLMMVVSLRKNSNLISGGKIVFITSIAGSIADNKTGAMYGYRMSKTAMNMAGVCLSRDLNSEGISVGIWNPGLVDTDLAKDLPGNKISTEVSISGMLEGIDDLNLETSGGFWHYNGKPLPW